MSKRGISRGLRALLGIGLLAFVVFRLDVGRIWSAFEEIDGNYLLLAALLQVLAKFVWALRWQDILRAVGITRRFRDLLALVLIGLFFNNFLPTSSGGDLVRGYFAAESREALTRSYSAVVVERVLGLITLAATAGVAGVVAIWLQIDLPRHMLTSAVAVCGLVAVVGAAVLVSQGWRAALARRFGGKVAEAADAMGLFQRRDTARFRIVAASFVLQTIGILFYGSCAFAVGIAVPWVVLFLVVPVSVVASMLPVTLNGLGVREGVFVVLLAGMGVSADLAAAFALLALAVATAFALLGGLVYPFYGRSNRSAEVEIDHV